MAKTEDTNKSLTSRLTESVRAFRVEVGKQIKSGVSGLNIGIKIILSPIRLLVAVGVFLTKIPEFLKGIFGTSGQVRQNYGADIYPEPSSDPNAYNIKIEDETDTNNISTGKKVSDPDDLTSSDTRDHDVEKGEVEPEMDKTEAELNESSSRPNSSQKKNPLTPFSDNGRADLEASDENPGP